MTIRRLFLTAVLAVVPVLPLAQQPAAPQVAPYQPGLNPESIKKPLADSWPTYSGDYTSRRYSALTQVNQNSVKNLTLAWIARVTAANPQGGAGRGGGGGGGAVPVIVGGEGTGEFGGGGG